MRGCLVRPLERDLPLLFRDRFFADLSRQIAVDGGDAGLDPLFRHVVERDLEARERAYMGDAAAHLTGADDAYPVNVHVCPLALRAIPKNAPSGSTAKCVRPPSSAVPPLVPLPGALRRTDYRQRPRYLSLKSFA